MFSEPEVNKLMFSHALARLVTFCATPELGKQTPSAPLRVMRQVPATAKGEMIDDGSLGLTCLAQAVLPLAWI